MTDPMVRPWNAPRNTTTPCLPVVLGQLHRRLDRLGTELAKLNFSIPGGVMARNRSAASTIES